eukprot:NODE_63_length_25098_cov_0.440498.p21 type:complete len:103 gc:universal NODE_63_length_25098_cov_0.440498:14330-14022(-)
MYHLLKVHLARYLYAFTTGCEIMSFSIQSSFILDVSNLIFAKFRCNLEYCFTACTVEPIHLVRINVANSKTLRVLSNPLNQCHQIPHRWNGLLSALFSKKEV